MLLKNKFLMIISLFGALVFANGVHADIYLGQELCIKNTTTKELQATYFYHGHTRIITITEIPANDASCITIPPPKYTPYPGDCMGHTYYGKLGIRFTDAPKNKKSAVFHLEFAPSTNKPSVCVWTISTQYPSKDFTQTITNIQDPLREFSLIHVMKP